MTYSPTYRGFTLIELLAVIAIIGILASIVMPNLSGARERARDSERVTEISELVLALELYYNACRQYPSTLSVGANNGCPGTVNLGNFISDIPTDPLGAAYDYAAAGGNFVVGATLETNTSSLADDLDSAPGGLSVDCTDANLRYCKGG